MTGPRAQLEVGRRYINAKNRQPLTLLYIGPLPPNIGTETSGPSATTIWLGVEYDDPTYGKGHSGTYEGVQIFETRQSGAGAFIRWKTGNEAREGKTFIQAINERYGDALDEAGMESVILGSSNAVVVEAPGMSGVSKRLGNLEKLRQIGLEDELICGVGGTEAERRDLAERLKGKSIHLDAATCSPTDGRGESVKYIQKSPEHVEGGRGDIGYRQWGGYAHHEVRGIR